MISDLAQDQANAMASCIGQGQSPAYCQSLVGRLVQSAQQAQYASSGTPAALAPIVQWSGGTSGLQTTPVSSSFDLLSLLPWAVGAGLVYFLFFRKRRAATVETST